jgi:hypothetical protein
MLTHYKVSSLFNLSITAPTVVSKFCPELCSTSHLRDSEVLHQLNRPNIVFRILNFVTGGILEDERLLIKK